MDNNAQYTVLARRFRPQTFEEVIGQQPVAQSLQNAIRSGRVAHAYLFTGARGVGKTSMARILAKALNCPHASDGVPCNACEICEGISAGNDVDVQEIDGASNRGIDDIRSLRANVNVKSMRTGQKVYIIDEVHMLTKEAFNALLKTLEEPPPNVKFVFCTTEPNKVPDTILSRCQRFDFSTIETQNIVMRLKQIAEAEGYKVTPDALELVARRAAGSMRDSQSIFDQLLAFGESNISADDVHSMLGTATDDRMVTLTNALLNRQRDVALAELNAMLIDGVELGELVVQLVNYFRDLMMIASGASEVPLLGVSEHSRTALEHQAKSWGIHTIVAALEILVETKGKMFRTTYGRALAELALVRISLLADLESLGSLMQSLREGNFPTVPLPAATASIPHAPVSSSSYSPEKKSESGRIESPSGVGTANSIAFESSHLDQNAPPGNGSLEEVSERKSVPAMDFRPGCEPELWSQVIAAIDDATKSHLKPLDCPAISGPNQLDLLFPASYHFSKQFCDRPEIRGQLERIATEIVGRPIRFVLRLEEGKPEQSKTPTPDSEDSTPAAKGNRNTLFKNAEQDSFVSDAVSIFNGTLRDVRELP
ncbi:MAG: DNA polymerase III subunit gamma/tau [Planctomycetaceae bacterium]